MTRISTTLSLTAPITRKSGLGDPEERVQGEGEQARHRRDSEKSYALG